VKERSGHSAEFKFHLIHIAPSPVLSRLEGFDNGVTDSAKVLCRMFVLGRIAAADMAADHAEAKMHPDIAHLQAFFASPGVRFDILNLAGV
jgi:hypothetical protein